MGEHRWHPYVLIPGKVGHHPRRYTLQRVSPGVEGQGFDVRSISATSEGRLPLSGPVFPSVALPTPGEQGRKELAPSVPPMWLVMDPQLSLDQSGMEGGDPKCVSVGQRKIHGGVRRGLGNSFQPSLPSVNPRLAWLPSVSIWEAWRAVWLPGNQTPGFLAGTHVALILKGCFPFWCVRVSVYAWAGGCVHAHAPELVCLACPRSPSPGDGCHVCDGMWLMRNSLLVAHVGSISQPMCCRCQAP